MEQVRETADQITKDTLILAFMLSALCLLLPQRRELIAGMAFGTSIAVLNFRLLTITVRKFTKAANPTRFLKVERLKRLIIYSIAFTVAVRKGSISNVAVLCGFLLPKAVIYYDVWYRKNILFLQEKVE